jgi:hypothetical protein
MPVASSGTRMRKEATLPAIRRSNSGGHASAAIRRGSDARQAAPQLDGEQPAPGCSIMSAIEY